MLYFEFLLYNVLNCVRNIHWQMFLKGRLLFPTKLSAIAKESLIPYNRKSTRNNLQYCNTKCQPNQTNVKHSLLVAITLRHVNPVHQRVLRV